MYEEVPNIYPKVASLPVYVFLLVPTNGIVSSSNADIPLNIDFPIEVTVVGIARVVTLFIFWKAYSPIVFTPSSIDIFSTVEQLEKAYEPMFVTFFGTFISVKEVQPLNAEDPMLVNVEGNVWFPKEVHPLKA